MCLIFSMLLLLSILAVLTFAFFFSQQPPINSRAFQGTNIPYTRVK